MATYNPPSFPRKPNPKHATIFSELKYQAHLLYYRYEINTTLYVMSPGEKLAYNLIFLSILVLLLSAFYYYLPPALRMSMRPLSYYFPASNKLDVTRMSAIGSAVLRSNGIEAMKSLADAGKVVNASRGFTP